MGRPKVFIIDDSALSLTMLRDQLEAAGFRVVTRETPIGASATILHEKPDIVLVDLVMTPLRGNDVIALFRKNDMIRNTRMLLLSDRPSDELQAIANGCGADGFVRKNLTAGDLSAQLHAWVPSHRVTKPAGDPLMTIDDVIVFVDDETMLKDYRSTFNDLPCTAYLSTAREALHLIRSEAPPGYIIAAWQLADTTADTLYFQAAAHSGRWRRAMAVAMDAKASPPAAFRDSGGPAIIRRPVDLEALRLFVCSI